MMGLVLQRGRSGRSIGIVILLSTLLFVFSPKRVEAGSAEQGSVLSGSLIESTRPIDSRGLSTWRTSRLRSPSGILYPYPHKPMPWSGESYQLRSLVDFGFVLNSGEASEAAFRNARVQRKVATQVCIAIQLNYTSRVQTMFSKWQLLTKLRKEDRSGH